MTFLPHCTYYAIFLYFIITHFIFKTSRKCQKLNTITFMYIFLTLLLLIYLSCLLVCTNAQHCICISKCRRKSILWNYSCVSSSLHSRPACVLVCDECWTNEPFKWFNTTKRFRRRALVWREPRFKTRSHHTHHLLATNHSPFIIASILRLSFHLRLSRFLVVSIIDHRA